MSEEELEMFVTSYIDRHIDTSNEHIVNNKIDDKESL